MAFRFIPGNINMTGVSMQQPIVDLQQVRKSYTLGRVRVPALHEVDERIFSGEFVALAGPSGSGKTTLLNIIGCVDKPDGGTIIIDGRDVTATPLHKLAALRRASLGYIFQTFNLLPVLTAFENVEYPLLLNGIRKDERHERVWRWLDHVGIRSQARQRPDQLSGGQRQRVAIARAMVTDPLLVLADEPTANLDSATAMQILDLLAEINRSGGRTFIFATHDPSLMERAGRVIHVRDGRIATDHAADHAAGVVTLKERAV
jgi:putative ABC transport system ATP-binding protein